MKIMWIVNTIFPYPASKLNIPQTVFGGWLLSLKESLKETSEIKQLAIATTYNGCDFKKYVDDNIIYYLLPCKDNNKYDAQLENYWEDIKEEFKPDLVHIHGTEYPHSLAFIRRNNKIKYCVSIQGLVSICGKKEIYNAGLKFKDIIKNITIRDIIKRDSLLTSYKKFLNKEVYEKEILQKSNIIIGRTNFDKINSYLITNEDKYVHCNESLRSIFYEKNWNIKNVYRHSIFISQATYPLKGFHNVIEALSILKIKYHDLKVFVAGPNIAKNNFKITGYGKLLNKLIKKYKLEENIVFLGSLKEEELCNYLLKSHVFLQTSSIENSSNSLGEAMLIGMPSVASYVGGTMDMLNDKEEGLLYPFNDTNLLINNIMRIFDDDNLAIRLGNNAQKHAKITHNREINTKNIIKIYQKLNKEK